MNEQEPILPPHDDSEELREQFELQRRLFIVALVIMIVLAGTLNVFWLSQTIAIRRDLERVRPVLNQYAQNQQAVNNIALALQAYGKTNPDFVPILSRYGLAPVPATNTLFQPK